MVLEKRVLRTFGPKRDDVTDECRLHNEKLQNFVLFTKCYWQLKENAEDRTCSTHGNNNT
jgi:hypothetical protein